MEKWDHDHAPFRIDIRQKDVEIFQQNMTDLKHFAEACDLELLEAVLWLEGQLDYTGTQRPFGWEPKPTQPPQRHMSERTFGFNPFPLIPPEACPRLISNTPVLNHSDDHDNNKQNQEQVNQAPADGESPAAQPGDQDNQDQKV